MNASILKHTPRRLTWTLSIAAALALAVSLHMQKPVASQGAGGSAASLEVNGAPYGSFTEVGIVSEITPIEYAQGGAGGAVVNTLPGKSKPPIITLRRSLAAKNQQPLTAWHDAARSGAPTARMNATLTLHSSGAPLVRYTLNKAWVSKLEVRQAPGTAAPLYIQTATIICDGMVRIGP